MCFLGFDEGLFLHILGFDEAVFFSDFRALRGFFSPYWEAYQKSPFYIFLGIDKTVFLWGFWGLAKLFFILGIDIAEILIF